MPVKIFLILSLVLLSSCKDEIPIDKLYIPDFAKQFTQEYIVTDKANLKVSNGAEFPLEYADKQICMTPEQYLLLKKWYLRQNPPPAKEQ